MELDLSGMVCELKKAENGLRREFKVMMPKRVNSFLLRFRYLKLVVEIYSFIGLSGVRRK